jgi:hypothetical protein
MLVILCVPGNRNETGDERRGAEPIFADPWARLAQQGRRAQRRALPGEETRRRVPPNSRGPHDGVQKIALAAKAGRDKNASRKEMCKLIESFAMPEDKVKYTVKQYCGVWNSGGGG